MQTITEIEELQAQIAELSKRIASLEAGQRESTKAGAPGPATTPVEPEPEIVSEEELLAISAAIAAFLGVRPHIRQIRLVGTNAWAQQGRVSIQASHTLQG